MEVSVVWPGGKPTRIAVNGESRQLDIPFD
jgi:hypothetical protein